MATFLEQAKPVADVAAVSTSLGIFAHWAGFVAESVIPPLVGVLSATWLLMQMVTWVRNKKWKRQ